MQNDNILPVAAEAIVALTILKMDTDNEPRSLSALRERLKAFAVPGLVAWFDEEYGVPKTRYTHATLSNGEVISEPVSG